MKVLSRCHFREVGMVAVGLVCLLVLGFSESAKASEWRFPVGMTGVTGYSNVVDVYKDNLETFGYSAQGDWEFPLGIAFNPYYEFDSGFRIGTGFGPIMYLLTVGASNEDDPYFFDFPVQANLGFTFFPKSAVAPYIRGGLMYHLASGDYVEDVSPGLFGAVGIEFMRNRKVSLGVEVAYDTSEIELKKYTSRTRYGIKKVKPYEVMISLYAAF